MSQIVRPSANTLSKVSIFGVLALVGGLITLAMVLGGSSYVTRAHEFVEQPIQFSHLHHVLDDGIDWLCQEARTLGDQSLAEFCDRLLSGLPEALDDDVAILALRARPAGG